METLNQPFTKVFYLEHGGKGNGSGSGPANARALADADLWAIPAGCLIKKCYVVVDVAITGTTDFDVGDDDDADGYVDGSNGLAAGLGTPGLYGYSAKEAGAYLRVQTAGGTDAADIDVTDQAKYYPAAGKELKLNVTTASTAGKCRVVVEGFMLGTNPANPTV